MSLGVFEQRLRGAAYGKNDQKWFPRWVARYAAGKTLTNDTLPVTKELVIQFSRSLLQSGTPAWQRLQGVRAVEAYRNLVLQESEPSLQQVKLELARWAATEKDSGLAMGSPGLADEQKHLKFRMQRFRVSQNWERNSGASGRCPVVH